MLIHSNVMGQVTGRNAVMWSGSPPLGMSSPGDVEDGGGATEKRKPDRTRYMMQVRELYLRLVSA